MSVTTRLRNALWSAAKNVTVHTGKNPHTEIAGSLERFMAVIEGDFVIIPRDELPKVPANAINRSAVTVGPYCFSVADKDLAGMRKDLAAVAAWVTYLEAKEAEAVRVLSVEYERKIKRREELASEVTDGRSGDDGYAYCSRATRKAIDRIIELEEAAAPARVGSIPPGFVKELDCG